MLVQDAANLRNFKNDTLKKYPFFDSTSILRPGGHSCKYVNIIRLGGQGILPCINYGEVTVTVVTTL